MAVEQVEITKVIRQNNETFERNIRSQDASVLVASFYAEGAAVMPQDHAMVNGSEEIRHFWDGMFKAGLRDAALNTLRAESEGDLAFEIGEYMLTIAQEAGNSVQSPGKYLVVLRRQADGSWKAIVDAFSGNGSAS